MGESYDHISAYIKIMIECRSRDLFGVFGCDNIDASELCDSRLRTLLTAR